MTNRPRLQPHSASSTPSPVRRDADNLKMLEQMRPLYERLKAEKIRTESDLERLEKEYAAARQAAIEALGTDDEDQIRSQIQEIWATNSAAVDDFRNLLIQVEADLNALPTD